MHILSTLVRQSDCCKREWINVAHREGDTSCMRQEQMNGSVVGEEVACGLHVHSYMKISPFQTPSDFEPKKEVKIGMTKGMWATERGWRVAQNQPHFLQLICPLSVLSLAQRAQPLTSVQLVCSAISEQGRKWDFVYMNNQVYRTVHVCAHWNN